MSSGTEIYGTLAHRFDYHGRRIYDDGLEPTQHLIYHPLAVAISVII